MKEVSKMEKRGKELVEENEKIVAEIGRIDKYKQDLVNKLFENNGAIKVINDFLGPIKEKNKDAIVAEVKKEEKKEAKKESKKGVK